MTTRRRGGWIAGVTTSLAVAVGLAVGLRAVGAMTRAGPVWRLAPPTLGAETLGIAWSPLATMPSALQLHAFDGLMGILGAMVLGTVSVATLNAAFLLAEASAAREVELAIRTALGASPLRLLRSLLRELRATVLAGTSLGIAAGIVSGLTTRALFPGVTTSTPWSFPLDTLVLVTAVLVALVVGHVVGAPGPLRRDSALRSLRAGTRTGAPPAAIFVRRALAGLHITIAGTVVLSTWAVLGSFSSPASAAAASVVVITAEAPSPTDWGETIEALRRIPGVQAESLAAPGAVEGLGVRDLVIAECGACSRGGLPSPLWTARADHFAVTPGFFDLEEIEILSGRDFASTDRAGANRVAIVSERFARTAFEGGRPIGKRIRVGSDADGWYTVVGVVADRRVPTLGDDGRVREAVYLSALQHPLARADILLRADAEVSMLAHDMLAAQGRSPTEPMSRHTSSRERGATLSWLFRVIGALGVLAGALAAQGIWLTSLQIARRRRRDVAVRRAVGATPLAIARYALAEQLRTTGWGLAGFVFFGSLCVGLVETMTGAPGPPPAGYALVATAIMVVSLLASARATREAMRVEPASVLD